MSHTYHVKTDGFRGDLFLPAEDQYPGKALICFSGSDGGIALARMLAGIFQVRGLTTLALAFVMEEGCPSGLPGSPSTFWRRRPGRSWRGWRSTASRTSISI